MAKIALYAHKWHYLDNYEPLIDALKSRGIDFDIILIYPRDDSYQKYKIKYGDNLKELYYEKWGAYFYQPRYMPIFLRTVSKVLFFKFRLKKLFKNKDYKILVTSDDRAVMHCAVLSAAKKSGLKTILYPYETPIFVEDLLRERAAQMPKPNLKRKIMLAISKKIFPDNILKYEDREVYRYHPREVIELYPTKILSKNPWISGGNSDTDIVATGSQIQKSENSNYGMSVKKMRVTGFPPHDTLSYLLNLPNSKIQYKKTFLILGTHWHLSSLYEHDGTALNTELNDILKIIISTIPPDYNFIFKVHPQMDFNLQKQNITKELRGKIKFIKNEHNTYDLIKSASITLNFMSSATIGALATDIPILCYRLFKKSTTTSEWSSRFCSTIQLETPQELQQVLLPFAQNTLLDKNFKEKRLVDRTKYGKFDGKSTDRFMQLIENMLG